jgi:predicted dehydrogenase
MLRCASIGLGWWAGMHATAIQGKSSLVRIEACHNGSGDPAVDAAAMQGFTERFGARAIARFEDVLADKTIDALIVTTPHSRHVPQIIAAARAGKHVLVEKPLALSVESGRSALDACRKAGVVLAVGHNRRFTSPLRAIKALVDKNALGTILHAEANFSYPGGLNFKKGYWRADPAEAPAGAMTATLIHMIDAFMHLLGPIDRVIGARSKHRAVPLDIEDTTSMLVEFVAGPTGYIGGSIAAADVSSLNLYGSAASIYAGIDEEQVTIQRGEGPRELLSIEPPTNSLLLEIEAFARACAGGPAFPVTPEEALRNIAVMEASIEAARTGGGVKVKPN